MASVISVSKSDQHAFSKTVTESIELVSGHGVDGDAHSGTTVKHRSRVAANPDQPNLRQVHLLHAELIDELQQQGFDVSPATLGENITTRGLDLLALPTNTQMDFPSGAQLIVTGLRNPCAQLDNYQPGLTAATLDRDEQGQLVRKAGIMAIVTSGGRIAAGDSIHVTLPAEPHLALKPV